MERKPDMRSYQVSGWTISSTQGDVSVKALVSGEMSVGLARSYVECEHEAICDDSGVRIVLMHSGEIDADYEGDQISMPPGTMTLMRGSDDVFGWQNTPSSRLGLRFPAEFFTSKQFDGVWGEPIPTDTEKWGSIFQLCEAVLNGNTQLDRAAADDFSGGIALLMRSMVSASIIRNSQTMATRQDQALKSMQEVIERNFRRSDFSVPQLAEQLFMAESSLRRLCANVGTTPLAEIRQRRIVEVKRLLPHDKRVTPAFADFIAHSTGFTSRTSMYKALGGTRPTTEKKGPR